MARRMTFTFRNIPLRAALDSLMHMAPFSIIYLDAMVEGRTVTASCTDCSIPAALDVLLQDTDLIWTATGSQVILQPRPPVTRPVEGTIAGVVRDAPSGEWLGGVNVLLARTADTSAVMAFRWCPTNSGGFYSLRKVPPGVYRVMARSIGYRTAHIPVTLDIEGTVRLDIDLQREDILLPEVSVEGRRAPLAATGTVARGLFIRSVPSDPTCYFLDGVRIYNPAHVGGVLSTFNPESLNDVDLLVGGLPPAYGGRIGGVLDYALRDGNRSGLGGSAGTGSLGLHLSLEGPVNGTTTFLLSGRRGFPDVIVPSLRNHGTPAALGSSELVAKISHRFSGSNRLSVNAYWGDDATSNQVSNGAMHLSNSLWWGNRALNVRWTGIPGPSLYVQASGSFTRYALGLGHTLTGFPTVSQPLSSTYAVEDVGVQALIEHYYDPEHTLRGGVELTHHRFAGALSALSTQIGAMTLDAASIWELSVFLQDQWRLLPGVTASLGARATVFTGPRGAFSSIDPRFSLLAALGPRTDLSASLTAINQYLHPYRHSGVFLLSPALFWYPSTDQIRPSSSIQVTAGLHHRWQEDAYTLAVEPYYRVTHNLHEVVLMAQPESLDAALRLGTGTTYGLQINLRKRSGDLTGVLGYAISWGENRFPAIRDGAPYAPRFDRRHELHADIWYAPLTDWAFGLLGVFGSDLDPSLDPVITTDGASATFPEITRSAGLDLNGSRLPGFQRLEIHARHNFVLAGVSCVASLRLLSAYGLLDPFDWSVRPSDDVRLVWSARMKRLRLFPLFPTFGLTIRF